MTSTTPCPDRDHLKGLLDCSLSPSEQERLAKHLDDCETCRQALDELAGDAAPLLAAARGLAEEPAVPATVVRQGLDAGEGPSEGRATRSGPAVDADLSLEFLSPSDQPGHLGRIGGYEVLEVI